jgi:hypothetical protein
MTSDKLTELVRAVPFRPFTIYLADGRRLLVPHPEFLSVSANGGGAHWYGLGGESAVIDLDAVLKVVRKPARRKPT